MGNKIACNQEASPTRWCMNATEGGRVSLRTKWTHFRAKKGREGWRTASNGRDIPDGAASAYTATHRAWFMFSDFRRPRTVFDAFDLERERDRFRFGLDALSPRVGKA